MKLFRVVFSMTRYTKPVPIIQIAKILFRFISKVDAFWCSLLFTAKFTNISTYFSVAYPAMQSSISNIIPFPINILLFESPDIYSASHPRFMPYTSFVTYKTFGNFLFTAWIMFKVCCAPDVITRGRTILSRITLTVLSGFVRPNGKYNTTSFANNLLHKLHYTTLTVYPNLGRRMVP